MPPSPVVVEVPTSLAARPRASLACADRAPKLMPAIVIGISRWSGLEAERAPRTVRRVASFSVSLEGVPRRGRREQDQVVEAREAALGTPAPDLIVTEFSHFLDLADNLRREGMARHRPDGRNARVRSPSSPRPITVRAHQYCCPFKASKL